MSESKNSFLKDAEEKALLYQMLSDLDTYREFRGRVHEDLFFSSDGKEVWSIIRQIELQKKEPSLVLVEDMVGNKDLGFSVIEWGIEAELVGFKLPGDLIDVLQSHANKRRLIDYRNSVDALIGSTDLERDEIMGRVSMEYAKLLVDTGGMIEMETADKTIDKLYEQIANGNQLQGITTGFKCVDQKVMGLKPGDLFVIGALTSGGKTALALNMVRNIASEGHEVAVFSLEMRPEKLYLRIAATVMGVPANRIANTNYWDAKISQNIGDTFSRISKLPIRMPPCQSYSIEKIASVVRQAHQRKKLDVVVIDYLQIISDPRNGDNRAAFISNVCSEIKALAMSLGIPFIVLAQVNRSSNKGSIHKPELWHLKESGSIEQAADVVLLIHRNKYKHGSDGYDPRLGDNFAELRIVKNREGECVDLPVAYHPELTQFTELDEEELKAFHLNASRHEIR